MPFYDRAGGDPEGLYWMMQESDRIFPNSGAGEHEGTKYNRERAIELMNKRDLIMADTFIKKKTCEKVTFREIGTPAFEPPWDEKRWKCSINS